MPFRRFCHVVVQASIALHHPDTLRVWYTRADTGYRHAFLTDDLPGKIDAEVFHFQIVFDPET
ncbi:hypothetical protein [Pectobacterium brasiliense]|uniref:hypothetical protein n=1 Tax=Pectobacterium brasiliense TaxID=180957 RepID=UPI0038739651